MVHRRVLSMIVPKMDKTTTVPAAAPTVRVAHTIDYRLRKFVKSIERPLLLGGTGPIVETSRY